MKPANFPGRVYARRVAALNRLPVDHPQRIVLEERTEGDARYHVGMRSKKDRTDKARIR